MLENWESEIWRITERYVLYKLDVDDGMFWLFDVEEGTCFNLNETSYFMLSCFEEDKSISEVLNKIACVYENEDAEVIRKDFNEFFEDLKDRKILELC